MATMLAFMAVFQRSRNVVWSLVFLLAVLFALGGCGGGSSDREPTVDPTPVPPERGLTGEFIIGQSETLASQDVGPQGGTLVVSRPGHPLDGLEVDIPEGAFDDSRQVTIASAEIFDHTFGSVVNPIAPLIVIEAGSDYANDIMTVRIPVQASPDMVAVPFSYHEKNGTIEGVPFVEVEPGSVTMATRRFSVFGALGFSYYSPLVEGHSLDKRLVEYLFPVLDSGFSPGFDDWQFRNYGSHVTPVGYGTGQVLTAFYHYIERQDSASTRLFGRYDNYGNEPDTTPDFEWDNALGIRLASSVQYDVLTSLNIDQHRLLRKAIEKRSEPATLTAMTAFLIYENAPQLIAVFGEHGSVVLIAYKIVTVFGVDDSVAYYDLYVADPNYPGDSGRRIRFNAETSTFYPYQSGDYEYQDLLFLGRFRLFNEDEVAGRWTEFDLRIVGSDLFPPYGLALIDGENNLIEDDDGNPLLLTDGYVSRDRTLRVLGIGRWNADDVGALNLVAFRDLNPVAAAQGDVLSIELTEGKNEIGFLVADSFDAYIDFEYIDVWHEEDTFEDPGRIEGRYDVIGADGGIVRDVVTGLEWQRCAVGQTWNPSTGRCDGFGSLIAWDDAVQETAPGGFRLPTDDELRTLVYCSSGSPALFNETGSRCRGAYTWPTIVVEAFPDTPADGFWSGSPSAVDPERARVMSFFYGEDRWEFKHIRARVRLVR
ncbi:MAG: DUF1566 domain-containing protein [Planctomycetaceae bacterium]|nr:MAG: DUF1566 domain-containing protein [Planctomycetaceae bacterium]